MFYLLHGPDTVSSRNALVSLKLKYRQSEVIVADGEARNLDELRLIFESPPMFNDRRLVVIEAPLLSLKKTGILEYLETLPNFIDVIFWQQEVVKKTNRLYQFIIKQRGIVSVFKESASKEVFPFLDAVIAKNKTRALCELERLLSVGKEPLYIIKMINWQIRNLLGVKVNSTSAANLHPFVLKKMKAHISHFNLSEIKIIYKNILKTDILLKTTRLDPELLLMRLVLGIVA